MKNKKCITKKVFALFFLLIFLIMLSGCTKSQHEVDDFAYVVAIGVDEGKDDNLEITLSFANPNAIGGGDDSGKASGGSDNLINFTVESSGIFNALNIANDNISKIVNLSHVKLFLFSEEVAKKGIRKYIDGFVRELSVRPATIVAVCDNSCKDYLKSITPKLEVNPEKYINDLFDKSKTAFLPSATLSDFFVWGDSKSKDVTTAYLGRLKDEKKSDTKKDKEEYSYGIDDEKTGNVPLEVKNKAVVFGTAFFDGYKLVGTGTSIENMYLKLLTGKISEAVYTIKIKNDAMIELSLTQEKRPEFKIDTSHYAPKVQINVDIQADIMSMEDTVIEKGSYKVLSDTLENDLEKNINKYLYKIVRDLKVDSVGIGNEAKRNFLTMQEWEKYDWHKKYPFLQYETKVNAKIKKFGLIDKSLDIGNEG